MKNFSEFSLLLILKMNLAKHGYTTDTCNRPRPSSRLWPVAMWSSPRKPAPVRRWPLCCHSSSGSATPQDGPVFAPSILTPTRELAIQIHEAFAQWLAAPGPGCRRGRRHVGEAPTPAVRKGAQVLIATPGRLYDFLSRQLLMLPAVRSSSSTKPTACSIWASCPLSRRILAATPHAADHALLRDYRNLREAPRRAHVRNAVRIEVGSTSKPPEKVDLHLYEVEQAEKLNRAAHSMLRHREAARFWSSPAPSMAPDRLAEAPRRRRREGDCHSWRPQPEPA